MQFSYENQGTASFLVCQLEKFEQIDEIGMGMLKNNQLPSVLSPAYVQVDEVRRLMWNISSKIDLKSFLEGRRINRTRLLNVFSSICEAFECTEGYLLNEGFFCMDKKYMFCDVSTGRTSLLYIPVVREPENVDIVSFAREILFSVQLQEGERDDYAVTLLNNLNRPSRLSVSEFGDLVRNLKSRTDQPVGRPASGGRAPLPPLKPGFGNASTPSANKDSVNSQIPRSTDMTIGQAYNEMNAAETWDATRPLSPDMMTGESEKPAGYPQKGQAGFSNSHMTGEAPQTWSSFESQGQLRVPYGGQGQIPAQGQAWHQEEQAPTEMLSGRQAPPPNRDMGWNAGSQSQIQRPSAGQWQSPAQNSVNPEEQAPRELLSGRQVPPPTQDQVWNPGAQTTTSSRGRAWNDRSSQPMHVSGGQEWRVDDQSQGSEKKVVHRSPKTGVPLPRVPFGPGANQDVRMRIQDSEYGQGSLHFSSGTGMDDTVDLSQFGGDRSASMTQAYPDNRMHDNYYREMDETTNLNPNMIKADTVCLMPSDRRSEYRNEGRHIAVASLRRVRTGQTMDIRKDVFHVGTEKSYADFYIKDNAAISRSHADIISRDGTYYIKDTNSMNHTYLNGEMLTSNTEYCLRSGDTILLANDEFEFKVR